MRTGFIGAGKVGFSLGKYLAECGETVSGYYSRNTDSAIEAAHFTDSEAFTNIDQLLTKCDVLFITVPDDQITSCYEMLGAHLIRGKIICHCSGALSSAAAFPGIEEKGAYAFSVHPMFAVSDKFTAYRELADVFFTIEGDKRKLRAFKDFLTNAGLHVQEIEASSKEKYHLAASIGANLTVALIQKSIELLIRCGFDEETARSALTPLVVENARHVMEAGPAQALTGPLERADEETLSKHLRNLDNEDWKLIYILLSEQLIPISERKHPERSYRTVRELLNQERKELEK